MVKCNDISQSYGEPALGLDGYLTTHIGPGTKTAPWTGEGFDMLKVARRPLKASASAPAPTSPSAKQRRH